jgi:hypothetical protein
VTEGPIFPEDENGDVLRRMVEHGDDLSKARNIEFQHVFPTKSGALAFLGEVSGEGLYVTISWYADERCWNVQVARHMLPGHCEITAMETSLEQAARRHGGNADGWGCLKVDRVDGS